MVILYEIMKQAFGEFYKGRVTVYYCNVPTEKVDFLR